MRICVYLTTAILVGVLILLSLPSKAGAETWVLVMAIGAQGGSGTTTADAFDSEARCESTLREYYQAAREENVTPPGWWDRLWGRKRVRVFVLGRCVPVDVPYVGHDLERERCR